MSTATALTPFDLIAGEKPATPKVVEPPVKLPELIHVRYDKIKASEVEWLWPGFIAKGKITVLAGTQGVSKSTLTCDLAARITRGKKWPNGEDCAPMGKVVLLSSEDEPSDTIKPRLEAAGARMDLVHTFSSSRRDTNGCVRPLSLVTDIRELEKRVKELGGVQLIIADPITSFLGGATSRGNEGVRAALLPFQEMAARNKIAVVAVTHLTKAKGSALNRVLGSVGLTAVARTALGIARDANDPKRRLLVVLKSNISRDGIAIGYTLVPSKADKRIMRLDWDTSTVVVDVDTVMNGGKAPSPREAAETLIRDCIAKGVVGASDIMAQAAEQGISESTLKRAKRDLGVIPRKSGYNDGWEWSLPEEKVESPKEATA